MVGILTFMSRMNFMLSWVEIKKNYYFGAWSFPVREAKTLVRMCVCAGSSLSIRCLHIRLVPQYRGRVHLQFFFFKLYVGIVCYRGHVLLFFVSTRRERSLILTLFIAHLSDIPMVYIKYPTMHKVHMHAGAIRQLLYGCTYVREIIHSLKLVDYLIVHTHRP